MAITCNGIISNLHICFQCLYFSRNPNNIYRFFFFKGVNIPWNIQVIIVLPYFIKTGNVTVFINTNAFGVSVDNAFNIFITQVILGLYFFKILTGINKQNIIWLLPAFLKHQYAGWY